MTQGFMQDLNKALKQIDRPGSYCVSGSAPAVLPGLEVAGLGPIGLPLTATQAVALKKRCEQAPYGKGKATVVDTSVRRVWRLTPEHFSLTNPDWESFLQQTVRKVQVELGLQGQKLESHLYDLLLYEPGSFFLAHRDGEKLDRMVATLVIVLPAAFEGGELVVRHEGKEQTIDFGGTNKFAIYFAAFYADCEHEIRPLRKGHRLCLVYNLTLAKSKKQITAPRHAEHVERVATALRQWADADAPRKLVSTLEHQYTPEGVAWDALKGVDRAKAHALRDAAAQAGCEVFLGLLTLHESGSAEGDYGDYRRGRYGSRSRWYEDDEDGADDNSGDYEMGEIYESSLTGDNWMDPDGNRLSLGPLNVEKDEVLDPEAIQAVKPEEDFEGYTGNAGMTLDRWYRHAAVFLWPRRRHFEVLCDAGNQAAVAGLEQHVSRWQRSGKSEAPALRAECVDFAAAIIARWPEMKYAGYQTEKKQACPLFKALQALNEPSLIKAYLDNVLPRDATVDPGKSLVTVCQKHGWTTFQPELVGAFQRTTSEALSRNIRILESFCLAKPGKTTGWTELCRALASVLVMALEEIDGKAKGPHDWQARQVDRAAVLAGLARALLASAQDELLSRVVDHALAKPDKYPLAEAHVKALTTLRPWLEENVTKPSTALAHWLAACREQLETLTARAPQPPGDYRRDAKLGCKCSACNGLRAFLEDPSEKEYRFRAIQERRGHLETQIHGARCDLDLKTDRKGSPHTLVCTKNRASHEERVKEFQKDQERLATVRAIQEGLPAVNQLAPSPSFSKALAKATWSK